MSGQTIVIGHERHYNPLNGLGMNALETYERPASDGSQVVTRRPLRKTFGRQVYNMNSENSELALVKLMELFNHSSVAITKRYLGLRQEEILQTYDCLTF